MNLDHRILLSQNIANPVQAIQQGVQAAGQATQLSRQNALDTLYRDQGAQIAAGDQGALNALAGFDPMASLGVQDARQTMQARTQNMEQARAAGARAAQQHAITLSAEERRKEIEATSLLVRAGYLAYKSGNMAEAIRIGTELTDGAPVDENNVLMVFAAGEGGIATMNEIATSPALSPKGPELTTTQREYDAARVQGYTGTFMDYQRDIAEAKRSQTNVNVNTGDGAPGLGKLSTDFGYVLDPETGQPVIDPNTGLPTAAPVPGSPAALEQQRLARSGEIRQENRARAGGTVIQDLQRALDLLPELGPMGAAEGTVGATTRLARARIPGTPENRIQQFTESALSNVGLDTLQAMREASPTGGALGQVPIQQQQRLEQVLGSLRLDQDPGDLDANLKRVMNIYTDVVYGSPLERRQAVTEGRLSPQENAEIEGMYYELPFDERGRPRQSAPPAQTQGQPGAAPGDFSAMTLNEVQSVDVGTLTPEQIKAFNARMRELLQ